MHWSLHVRRLSYFYEAGWPLQFQLADPLTGDFLPLPSLRGITVWLLLFFVSTALGTLDWPRWGSPPHLSLCPSPFSEFRVFAARWLVLNLHGFEAPAHSEFHVAGLSLLIVSSGRHSRWPRARTRIASLTFSLNHKTIFVRSKKLYYDTYLLRDLLCQTVL